MIAPVHPALLLSLALGAASPSAPDSFKTALEKLLAAERARDPDLFAAAAASLLEDDSARAVEEVLDSYGRFVPGARPALDPAVHYRLHSDLARALSTVTSAGGIKEILRQREKARAWEVRLVSLDAASFRPDSLNLRGGAMALLRDRSPAVVRRALEYLKHDRTLSTVDAVLARYLEVDLPRGPKGEDWNRLRFAFRSALTALLRLALPAAVDYRSYLDARREKPEELFDRPPPDRGSTRLTVFGVEVSGNHIAFVIDVSGSMMATDPVPVVDPGKTVTVEKTRAAQAQMIDDRRRINRAKKELTQVVQALPEGKKFNIIAYSSEVRPWKKVLTPVAAEARKEALEFIAGLVADGITVTDEALEAAFSDLAVDTIYLITDGAPTHVGGSGPELPPDAPEIIEGIHRRVREVNYFRGVRIFTLGFPEAEEKFLKKLAADNSGVYTPIR